MKQDRASLFSFTVQSWRSRPLVSYMPVAQPFAATTTDTGLKVKCEIDRDTCLTSVKFANAEMESINIHRHDFHSGRNCTVAPKHLIRSNRS